MTSATMQLIVACAFYLTGLATLVLSVRNWLEARRLRLDTRDDLAIFERAINLVAAGAEDAAATLIAARRLQAPVTPEELEARAAHDRGARA